jgi:hypothetical protein
MDVRSAAVNALDSLRWTPDHGEVGAQYWIAKGEFERCVSIGRPAVEPLISALKDWNRDVRFSAAKALGELAKKNPRWLFNRWDDIKTTIEASHYDHSPSSDCGSHTDNGIGISFPGKPRNLDF